MVTTEHSLVTSREEMVKVNMQGKNLAFTFFLVGGQRRKKLLLEARIGAYRPHIRYNSVLSKYDSKYTAIHEARGSQPLYSHPKAVCGPSEKQPS